MRPKKHRVTGSNDLFRERLDQIINMTHEPRSACRQGRLGPERRRGSRRYGARSPVQSRSIQLLNGRPLSFCDRVIPIDAGDLKLSAHGDQLTSCASGNVHVPGF
jgi:hypothetical protein